jgi:hypothetical protein
MSTRIRPTTRGNTVWADAVAQRNGFSRVSDVEGDVRPSGTIGAGLKSAGPRLAIRSPRWRGRASSLSDRCRGFGRRGRGEAERASASSSTAGGRVQLFAAVNGWRAAADPDKPANGLDELGHRNRLRQIVSQPPWRMRSSSLFIAKAVTATTGMAFSSGSSLSHLVTSRPETSGSWMSIRTKSGRCLRARSSASMPSRVPTVW